MKTPSASKTKGEQLLERGVWYKKANPALAYTALKIL